MSEHTFSNQLCHSFYQVNKLFNQFYLKNLKDFDLTYTQYLVLLVLWEKSPINLKELGETLDLASNTLTPLLKRLEDKGYITRLVPEKDKRKLIIDITEKGEMLQNKLEEKLINCFHQLEGLTAEKTKIYIDNNKKMIDRLQKYLNKEK
ncbi:MarR family transcriptional regulator [Gemella sp. GH3]|uniref:MarR family winged helix-turn-helix transcriptional regulator n=1 Tax=unclassified Gemella TaxID=2624949 RepID=UPI0015CFF049|nr:MULTISPECIES: MarR family transcriptional regulator [unclassified Gemella]MBF0714032.1 MarR family transcriptional regulator [Gemella sp. GH3.1]NYS50984.1 MarR family transcriptional regulator [Gemella sp. GH3]